MIHFHGLPMTPRMDFLKAMRGKHAMVSFEHPDQINEAAEICQSVVLDNGAFSAWKQKKPYEFDGYYKWAEYWIKHPAVDWCVIPDVIDGDEKANRQMVERWPLATAFSVPVFHLHESNEYLDYLCSTFPRVALGSSGQYADPGTPTWWGRMAEIMSIVCDTDGMPKAKLHGLRMLDPVIFSHLPFSSADSCNVARNIGLDVRWEGAYTPRSKWARAMVMIDRIEAHASARRWIGDSAGTQQNMELIG